MAKKWGRRAEDQEYFVRLSRAEVWQHNIVWIMLCAAGGYRNDVFIAN